MGKIAGLQRSFTGVVHLGCEDLGVVGLGYSARSIYLVYGASDLLVKVRWVCMSAALFALAGTLVGVLGTILTDYARGRREDQKLWREEFKSICADFIYEISRFREIGFELYKRPDDVELQRAAQEAHTRSRALQERLRLTSKSLATQEAGRWLIHCAFYHWRSTQGGKADFWQAREGIDAWLTKFYIEARKELGLGSSAVYEDPPEGLPVPRKES